MKKVLSCSRRTDMVAFYYQQIQNILQNKFYQKENLISKKISKKIIQQDFSPENIHSIVLWSKNFANLINKPEALQDYNLFLQFTINNYSIQIEKNVIMYQEALEQLERLIYKYGTEKINWRFDPIFFNNKDEEDYRLKSFHILCHRISEMGIKTCTFSFIDIYPHINLKFLDSNRFICSVSLNDKINFTKKMLDISSKYEIKLNTCAEYIHENFEEISCGKCIDGNKLTQLFGGKISLTKDNTQRDLCNCTKSLDIGSYLYPCRHNCLYCYAQQ